jgi:drug/metabolite transporter (DMT)-like permease
MLWVTVMCVATPALFYQNTGYEQFGYRFSLDYTPYLILLLAVGRRPLSRTFKVLVLAGVAVNTFGAVTFKRFHTFYSNGFFL